MTKSHRRMASNSPDAKKRRPRPEIPNPALFLFSARSEHIIPHRKPAERFAWGFRYYKTFQSSVRALQDPPHRPAAPKATDQRNGELPATPVPPRPTVPGQTTTDSSNPFSASTPFLQIAPGREKSV